MGLATGGPFFWDIFHHLIVSCVLCCPQNWNLSCAFDGYVSSPLVLVRVLGHDGVTNLIQLPSPDLVT